MFCLYINTPVCCMYFASLNINLATYFSLTRSCLLKLLLSSTPDSLTPSGPLKFEASIKRAAQPTSWSQRLARLWTRHLHPNSELNRGIKSGGVHRVGGVWIGTAKDDYGGLAICWDQSSGRSFSVVRATAEWLSRDLAGDPKHIYKHKIRQESAPSRGS